MTLRELINDVIIERIRYALDDMPSYRMEEQEAQDRKNIRKCLTMFVDLAEAAGFDCCQESDCALDKLSDRRILMLIYERITQMTATAIVSQEQFDADLQVFKSAYNDLKNAYAQQNQLLGTVITAYEAAVAKNAGTADPADFSTEDGIVNGIKTDNDALVASIEANSQALSAALAQVQTTGSTAVTQANTPAPVDTPVATPEPVAVDPNANPNSTAPTTITPAPVDTETPDSAIETPAAE